VDGGRFWRQALEAGAAAAVIGPHAALLYPPDANDPVLVLDEPVAQTLGDSPPLTGICLVGAWG